MQQGTVPAFIITLIGGLSAAIMLVDLPYYDEDSQGNIVDLSPAGEPNQQYNHTFNTSKDWSGGWTGEHVEIVNDSIVFEEKGSGKKAHTAAIRADTIEGIGVNVNHTDKNSAETYMQVLSSNYWDFEFRGEYRESGKTGRKLLEDGQNKLYPKDLEGEYYRVWIYVEGSEDFGRVEVNNITIEGTKFQDTPLIYPYN